MTATKDAFDHFRGLIGEARPVKRVTPKPNEVELLTEEQGLTKWVDGGWAKGTAAPEVTPTVEVGDIERVQLWVVLPEDVLYALEHCEFAEKLGLEKSVIKHTNLTGGASAFAGGEVVRLDNVTVIISGNSGRYGPETPEELFAVARAFADSGYGVWLVGWDEEAKRPAPLRGSVPHWLS
jgi:hypothetical protein